MQANGEHLVVSNVPGWQKLDGADVLMMRTLSTHHDRHLYTDLII